ncbi:hypothetical protein ACLB1R_15665 [Escherichia coli]
MKKLNPQAQWRNPVMFIVFFEWQSADHLYWHRDGERCDPRQCAVTPAISG